MTPDIIVHIVNINQFSSTNELPTAAYFPLYYSSSLEVCLYHMESMTISATFSPIYKTIQT